MTTFTVIASPKVSDLAIEAYNAVLTLKLLIEEPDMCVIMDNEALYGQCHRALQLPEPTHADLNHLIMMAMSGITSQFRYPGQQLNNDMGKMAMNMVPFHLLKFLMSSLAPLLGKGKFQDRVASIAELTYTILDARSMMCKVDPRHGRYLEGNAV